MKEKYDGLQKKEKNKDGWIKYDRFGYEGLSEVLACRFSKLLKTRLLFCDYSPIRTPTGIGCFSKNVLSENKNLISLHHFFPKEPKKLHIKHILEDYIPLIIDITGLSDFGEWLTELFIFDMLIENEDRNPGNIVLFYDGVNYSYAPVMDNANSLGYRHTRSHIAKPLMIPHDEQVKFFNSTFTTEIFLKNNELVVSDLNDFYDYNSIDYACTILNENVQRYFGKNMFFY